MTEKPILFNSEMVIAILEGRKTQTRRICRDQTPSRYELIEDMPTIPFGKLYSGWIKDIDGVGLKIPTKCPYGMVGDRLWVREKALYWTGGASGTSDVVYQDDPLWDGYIFDGAVIDKSTISPKPEWCGSWKVKPSIHMPRWASRITLEVVSVRVERVQEISYQNAIDEGIEKHGSWFMALDIPLRNPVDAFKELWNSINDKRGFGWDENPWVWIVEFKRVDV